MYSCISAGTELAAIDSSSQSLLQQAIKQPEKIKKFIDTLKQDGVQATIQKIQSKSDTEAAVPLGYSASGVVVSVGQNIGDIQPGDRVACAGAGIANHAEYIEVPRNLLVKIPAAVDYASASTVTLGAIALQGVRRADVRLGEWVAVIGLGILGQLTVQLLKAAGCSVIGVEIDHGKIEKALSLGMDKGINSLQEDAAKTIAAMTDGRGVDAAIITAATSAKEPLAQAFQICRKKGRVVLVGVVGMEINRDDMYPKELDFLISTSYGPGRYDESYEQRGIDYPYAYVRWTENRNMQAYLHLLADKKIAVQPLIDRQYPIEQAATAYEELQKQGAKPLITLLQYTSEQQEPLTRKTEIHPKPLNKSGLINIALVGAGSFAKGMHLPNLVKLRDRYALHAIASRTGSNAKSIAQKYGARYATTDYTELLNDADLDAVIIATRHNLHAKMAAEFLQAGKAVFLEKPMALNQQELDLLVAVIQDTQQPFMVGFNRRFSKYAAEIKRHLAARTNPMIINYQMNAGYIPLDNWVHTDEGGGRIIGEACHIFDLFNYFTDAEAASVSIEQLTPATGYYSSRDNAVITLKYKDGSVCSLTYTAIGNNRFPKESCQIFFDGKIITLDDYKKLSGYGLTIPDLKSAQPDKGQKETLEAFAEYARNAQHMPIPLWQMIQATEISFMSCK
jgi:predicted dehydrogenase